MNCIYFYFNRWIPWMFCCVHQFQGLSFRLDESFISYPCIKCPSGRVTKDSNGSGYRSALMIYFESNINFVLGIHSNSAPFGALGESNLLSAPLSISSSISSFSVACVTSIKFNRCILQFHQ